ncbi:hypothetical protein HanRHA438_Chr11g0518381 [Helianthus annuus]|nr:hypothetical protein HanRHA438_Chr11g0518381 [Helianthus annuus]
MASFDSHKKKKTFNIVPCYKPRFKRTEVSLEAELKYIDIKIEYLIKNKVIDTESLKHQKHT